MTSTLSRRKALGLIGGAAATLPCSALLRANAGAQEAPQGSLAAIAAGRGLLFGASMAAHELDKPHAAAYADLYERQCGIITPDLELKLAILKPAPGHTDYSGADRIVSFAEQRRIALRGHTLIWNDYVPAWIGRLSGRETERFLREHIAAVMGRYKGRMHSWDVVNEPVAYWESNPGMLRTGPFYSALGEDYIALSFKAARAADPAPRLVLNEAWTERGDLIGLSSREALLRIVRRLKDRDVPLDAIGIQSHLDASVDYDFEKFAAFLARFSDMGLEIQVTELDIDDTKIAGSVAERDRTVADLYERYLTAVLANPAVSMVVTWQLSDRTSGIGDGYLKKGVRLPHPPRPLPFDDHFAPKPARDAVARALAAAPLRAARP